jgi:uncharacterized protein (DUF2062 family)
MLVNIQKIKDLWGRLLHQEASSNQIAGGFALGLFISFIPLPCQTILALVLAFLFRLNKVATLVGVHLHLAIFPIIPVVFFTEYHLGRFLFPYGHTPELKPYHFELLTLLNRGWPILRATLLGAVVLGIPIAILGFFGVRQAASRWKRNGPSVPPVNPPADKDGPAK